MISVDKIVHALLTCLSVHRRVFFLNLTSDVKLATDVQKPAYGNVNGFKRIKLAEVLSFYLVLVITFLCRFHTCFTVYACESIRAFTCVPVDLIHTGGIIGAGITNTFVNIWKQYMHLK